MRKHLYRQPFSESFALSGPVCWTLCTTSLELGLGFGPATAPDPIFFDLQKELPEKTSVNIAQVAVGCRVEQVVFQHERSSH